MNKSARKAVNLSVLQRHDPHITDIIDSSSYVVVYKFDEASQAWVRRGCDIFLCYIVNVDNNEREEWLGLTPMLSRPSPPYLTDKERCRRHHVRLQEVCVVLCSTTYALK